MKFNRWAVGFVVGLTVACATGAIIPPQPPPQPPPVVNRAEQPLHMGGGNFAGAITTFRYPDEVEFRWKGITDFLLFPRYLGGENIEPILDDRVSVGANTLRTFGMLASFGNPNSSPADGLIHFYPQEHPDYFDKARAFADLLRSKGLRVEFVAFADAQIVMPNQGDQLAHWQHLTFALGDKPNVFLQVVNQAKKNGVDPTVFPNPHDAFTNLLASRDSGMESDNPPPPNGFAYSAYTSSRDDVKWFTEQGSSMFYLLYGWGPGQPWQGTLQASILDEPLGAAETNQPGRRSNDPYRFKQLARSLVWGNGATFHCDDCIQSQPLGPIQRAAAREFFGNLP